MKKDITIITIVITAAFLAALMTPAIAWPESHNNPPDNNCVCTHYSESEFPGYYDQYTGVGLVGTYSGSKDYSSVYIDQAEAGYGGYYPFWPNDPTSTYVYYGAEPNPQKGNMQGLTTLNDYNYANPTYPVYKSGNGQWWDYYERDWSYYITNQPLNMTFVETQQWFYWQQFPNQPWLDGGAWIEVYTS